MDISLIVILKCLNFCIHVFETHLEEIVSQIFDIGIRFCFIVCRRWVFVEIWKKSQKLPVFCYK